MAAIERSMRDEMLSERFISMEKRVEALQQMRAFQANRVLNRNLSRKKTLTLWFRGKHRGIAGDVFDLLHGDNGHFFGGINLKNFHIIADGMADRVLDQQFLIVGKHDFYPIHHNDSSVDTRTAMKDGGQSTALA